MLYLIDYLSVTFDLIKIPYKMLAKALHMLMERTESYKLTKISSFVSVVLYQIEIESLAETP